MTTTTTHKERDPFIALEAILNKLIFSQTGVYRLQQLANQVHMHTGVRHKLSDQQAMLQLLRDSALSNDDTIQEYLAAFTNELDDSQKASLLNTGVLGPEKVALH